MKKKRRQQWIAMLMTVVMMFQTVSSVAMAQSPKIDGTVGQVQTEPSSDAAETELVLPERVASWSQDYETATTQEEADALRNQDEDVNLLITAKECELSGLKYGEIVSTSCERLDLSEMTAKLLSVGGSSEIQLKGTELEQLIIQSEEEQEVTLHIDADTKVPEIILEGNGSVLIEGNGALGLVRVTGALKKATVRATCSVLNESGEEVQLETPDGEMALAAGQQEELVLSSYMVTFMADGQVYDSKAVKPGETIVFPEQNPEKEGYIFTTWYKDEEFTESCSQFEAADGEKVFYARFVEESESIKVTFDSMGGRELEPQIFAKGETLLTRPINEIYTEKEGYSFGGWCTDPECTTAFSYTQPLEESMTLYAFFVSEEVQTTEKDGTSSDMKDFDWQGSIPLRTEEKMTLEEVEKNIRVEAGSGALEPVLDITETEDGFAISGSYYEKDGETGFEPGATFSIILSGGVHFGDYPDDTDTAVVSVYKERVEVVGFSEDMTYVLWDDVLEYSPIVLAEDEPEETEAESETETETETSTEAEIASETGEDPENEAVPETETEQDQSISDPDGDAVEEQEGAAYIPGELLVKDTVSYQEGDIVAFYDGEIGRDEKNIDAYTEGSLDGYVLFAQILSVEDTADGVHLTYGYASPEDYLADFDVHITDDVEMDQQLSDEDLEVLTSRLSRQVEENEELKAQMMVAVMSAPETQDMLDDMYGEGVYSLAGMNAILTPGKPVIKLTVSGSEVTANISISATAKIMKDGKALLTIQPKLAFTQSLSVQTNVDGGAVWIDMAITIRSMSKIELTVTATTGGKTSVFTKAKDSLTEIVKPEGIVEGEYDSYDESVSDLMDTMNSIVSTSLKYNDLFDILLLNLKFSFYGIITVGFEVHLVGQVGVLATFGVEIVARSGERIGFKYNFLKFKGSSYTEKLESSVTNNIYLIGKVGARVGLRLTFSVTLCGIASAYITGSLYAYAELTGLFFNTTNLLTGANTNLGALKFEVGIDVVVSLGLKVNLIIKTIRKSWTVFSGRWPLWSTSISSKMSYMDEEELSTLWEKMTANADHRSVFGFEAVPMKTWDLLNGNCQKNEQLFAKSEKYKLSIENLTLDGESVPSDDPRNAIFTVGTSGNNQNPGFIYMDELMVGQYGCSEIALDLVLTYEDHASSALVKKQVQRFHLEKKCELSTTTQKVKVVLYDWCARNWGIEAAAWDNAQVFETSFFSSHMIGGICEQNATGTLDLGEVIVAAQSLYPELSGLEYGWGEPVKDGTTASIQYSSPRISNFCFMTTDNGVVRFDVYPGTQEYEVTYYLFIRRFEGFENMVNYHIRLNSNSTENEYAFSVLPTNETKEEQFTKDENGVYNLSLARSVFDGTQCPIKLSVNGGDPASTGFTVTGREYQKDVYFDMNFGKVQLNIALGEGVEGYQFANPEQMSEEGIQPGEKVELDVTLKEGYGGLEVLSENKTIDFTVTDEKVSFVMPAQDLTITLQAYKKHSILYQYNYGGLDEYQKVYFTENQVTREVETPVIDGLTFRGWYTTADCSGEPYQFGETLTTDLILYADWTCNVTVSFGPVKGKAEYVTGEEENQQVQLVFDGDESEYYVFTYSTLHVGDKLLNIQTPEYEGYQFMDWYLDAEFKTQKLDLSSYILTGGVTIYAKWARELELTYDRNDPVPNDDGQSTVIQQMVGYYGYPVPFVPEDPEYLHYRFTGWYRNPAATVPFDVTSDVLTADTTLYAGWEPVSYRITYDLDGGENASSNPTSYTTEDRVVLEAPTKVGYDFVGWTGTGLEAPVEQVIVEMGDGGERTYKAHWSPIEYTINYEKTYGSAKKNPVSYTIESGDIVLERPQREKYEFCGWVGTDLTEATLDVEIPAGSIGDRTYRATWDTEDPTERILLGVELLLEQNPYNDTLLSFLTAEDFNLGNQQLNKKLEPQVQTAVNAQLKSMVESDVDGKYPLAENRIEIGAYAGSIELNATQVSVDRTSDNQKQIYTYKVSIQYTDESSMVHKREVDYTVYLNKLVPQVKMPVMRLLTYGQKVSDSLSLSAGRAVYENTELGVNIAPIIGNFVWNKEELDKVPYGLDNGTENGNYKMTFQPTLGAEELYATVEGSVGLLTQIGVMVEAKADDRYYNPGDTSATGTAELYYVNTDGTKGEKVNVSGLLNEGTFTFVKQQGTQYIPDAAPMPNKTVLYNGYSLNAEVNEDLPYGKNVYHLVSSDAITVQASIKQVGEGQMQMTYSVGTYEYDTQLSEVELSVSMKDKNTGKNIDGSWSWKDPTEKLSTMNFSGHDIIFAPKDTGYAIVTKYVMVKVKKKTVTVPSAPKDLKYNGSPQTSGLKGVQDVYTVTDNGGTNAGDYTATLTLTNPDCYCWNDGTGNTSVEVSYTIGKGTATVSGTASCSGISYGQKLMTNGQSGQTGAYLATNISGLTVKFNNKTINGRWEWKLDEIQYGAQPWDASETVYEVPIYFIPSNEIDAKNIEIDDQTVSVKVNKVTPSVRENSITASMYQTQSPIYHLSSSVVSGTENQPVNPYTGDAIAGSWSWEGGESIPSSSGPRNYLFTPSDTNNYTDVSVPVYVTIKSPTTVSYEVKAVESLSKPWWNSGSDSYYTGGITTSDILTGPLKGKVDAPKSNKLSANKQDISFTLSDTTNYYVSAIRVKATGYSYGSNLEGSVNVPYYESYYEAVIETSPNTIAWDDSYIEKKGSTYTIHNLLKFVLAWDSIEVEVVVKSTNSSKSKMLSARRASTMQINNTTSSEAESETTAPTETEAQTSAPETESETSAPETSVPETSEPETSEPETSAPETSAPETSTPETSAPETSAPETEAQTSASEPEQPAAEADEAA